MSARTAHEPVTSAKPSKSRLGLAIATILSGAAGLGIAPQPVQAAGASGNDLLGEIVVTSRKREENLQDVPQSIDVFSAKDLEHMAISNFEDWATKSPSIAFISIAPGSQLFMMRGVSDGSNPQYANNSMTAYLVDDMSLSFKSQTPDLHQYDIERIEVLNGPQGTTFGASAMSGAVRVITNKADPKAFSAGLDLTGGSIDGGSENNTIEGFINIPLVEGRTAIRIAAYDDYRGGFIDNVLSTRHWVNGTTSTNAQWAGNNFNTERTTGARISLQQVFNDHWSASLTYTYQSQTYNGVWEESVNSNGGTLPVWGKDNVSRFGPEGGRNDVRMVDLHVDGDVGIGDLVFASTYWDAPSRFTTEYSEYMQYANAGYYLSANYLQGYTCKTDPVSSYGAQGYSGCNVPTLWYDFTTDPTRFSNEIRLQSKPGGQYHWLGGVYWERTTDPYTIFYHMPGLRLDGNAWQSITSYYNQTAAPPTPDDWYSYVAHNNTTQLSEFLNASWDITDRWSVELGTTHFHSTFDRYLYGGFTYLPQTPADVSGGSSKWNSKVGINYKVSQGTLFYANWAQGFRSGGANSIPNSCISKGSPATYAPDTLNNFEVGWKSLLADGHLVWNGAIYTMSWKNMQSSLYDPTLCPPINFTANIGDARVWGAESNVDIRATDYLSFKASASYTDSTLRSITPEIAADHGSFAVIPGERLPYVPYFSYSASGRFEHPVSDRLKGHVQLDIAHKGDVWNDIRAISTTNFPRVLQPQYNVSNLRVGISEGDGGWLGELFITNLMNKNAVIYSNTNNYDLRQTVNEPRVIGVRLSYRWKGAGH